MHTQGVFSFLWIMKIYDKPPLTYEQQLAKLKGRGLINNLKIIKEYFIFFVFYAIC
jgi:hypothetical protein